MKNRRLCVAAALLTVFAAREASGGDIYHFVRPSKLVTEKGAELRLPPGYFLDEKSWQERDLEMRRLQEQETRLGAENRSLRESADKFPWVAAGVTGAAGVAIGVLVMILK